MKDRIQGIAMDLGTANCEVYVLNKDFVTVRGRDLITQKEVVMKQIRSVIAQSILGDRDIVAIGQDAYDIIGRTPDDIHVVRPIRLGRIQELHSVEKLITHLINLACEHFQMRFPWNSKLRVIPRGLRADPIVVVGTPQTARSYENEQLAGVIRRLGGDPYIISEAVAAAFGAEIPIENSKAFVIVDIGGGTTDVAILSRISTLSRAGFHEESFPIGGDLMDQAIVDHVKAKGLDISIRTAEWVKQQMGSVGRVKEHTIEDGTTAAITEVEVKGRDKATGQSTKIKLNWEQVKKCLVPVATDVAVGLRRYFERLDEPQLHSDIYDSGIWLTGGGSLVQDMDSFISDACQLQVKHDPDPLGSVINGEAKLLMQPELLKKYNLVAKAG